MKKSDGLVTGWLDTSIGALMRKDVTLISQFAFVMLSSVDSMTNLRDASFTGRLLSQHPESWFLGSTLILPGVELAMATKDFNLFNGFDEIWCFDKPPKLAKPPDLWIVAPLRLDTEVPRSLKSWMMTSECLVGLGDGIGLNYVTPDEAIAASLERIAASFENVGED